MGRLHARTVAQSAARDGDCRLALVVDRHRARAAALVAEFGGEAVDDLRRVGDVDVAIVAVPTAAHVETALAVVEAGRDVLVEKPLALDAAHGEPLVARAEALGRILQVGHVEWYNPRWRAALARAGMPRRIRVERLHPASERGLDVDVVQDLMLHDLDWVTRGLREEVESFDARGQARRGGALDVASVELRFRSGCVASLRASRVHGTRLRRLEIEGDRERVAVDLLEPVPSDGVAEPLDPLAIQWRRFVEAVSKRERPENDGRVGLAALVWVERVRARIRAVGAGEIGADDSLVGG
ncbi:MAG: Gfo/Idh/MocA family oxidoreductase [Deltaproteobacteria bacterium]|nr:Gfo/Idh/MocA family oxidoreductase [Deltaproteobacteria bacterium]